MIKTPSTRIVNLIRMRTFAICLLLLVVTGMEWTFAQSRPETFWDDVEVNVGVGVNNFHGDFNPVGDGTIDYEGFFLPVEGMNAQLGLSKPFGILQNPKMKLLGHFNLNYVSYRSRTLNDPNLISSSVLPVNIINHSYGGDVGLSYQLFLNDRWSVEPIVKFGYRLHNPKTDALADAGMQILSGSQLGGIGGADQSPYELSAIDETRGPGEENAVGSGLMGASGGIRISKTFLGHYRWFAEYSYLYFLDDYFDNTSELASSAGGRGPENNDSFTLFTVGVNYPIYKEKRSTEEVTQKRVRIDREKIAKIERIQNIANLVTTDEDLRELQRIMSDKILLYDTPGVRFNELAAEAEEQQVQLGDSDLMTEMIELPGGSYIMGLTAVDELNIQVQGRKRITINPFMIDKYEVTNQQYRTFLIAMGAINPPVQSSLTSLDTLTSSNQNYGSPIEWNDLMVRANLDDLREHVGAPPLNGPADLLPDSTQWKKMGLDDVVPWNTYFRDTFYNNYPVVCVNWYQAKLFAAWSNKRLLTESEWEFAARSGISGRVYPWDGLDVQTKTGKYRANFKQDRGVYQADGYAIMAPVESFVPNDFGIYNMAGNVAEWVLDSYNPSYVVLQNVGTSNFVSPSYTNSSEPRKIHRGGSWQSTKFFIGVGVRNFQDKKMGTPFVGFRCAKSVSRKYE